MRRVKTGGGFPALWYSLKTAWRVGGLWPLYRALRTKNACKTCALGMGGQAGGMVNERGSFPEVCKKSMQAMAADMQGRIGPEFWSRYSIAQLRSLSPRELEHMGRLAEPVYAGPNDTHFRPIAWDNAAALCVDWLKKTPPARSFFYSSGRSSNEAAFLLQLFARLYGTNNVNNCSYYCHQASGVGLKSGLGTTTATVTLDDLHHCDLVFLIGGNPASNHPRLMEVLTGLRRRGGHVVVINPIKETGLVNFSVPSRLRTLLFGQEIANLYVQPHIGGDIALLMGIAKRIVDSEENAGELRASVNAIADGFDALVAALAQVSWEQIERSSGVDRARIDEVARLYRTSKATIFAWTMGITHHTHGVDNVRAIVNLALLRGMVGRPGAGLLPIRGHSNVQGIGSMGVTPQLAQQILERIESRLGVALPRSPGMDTLSCVEAMDRGEMRAAWCIGGNLFGSNPDANWATRAFARLDSCVYLSTTLNTGHAWGRGKETLILPVKARDEESQPTTQESMFNYVRLSDGGPPRLTGPRSEVEIIAEWGQRVLSGRTAAGPGNVETAGWAPPTAPTTHDRWAVPTLQEPGRSGPIDWNAFQRHRDIRQAIAACVPGYAAIGEIDETKREFQIEGRTVHEPKFNTPTGRARFHVVAIPDLPLAGNELRLMTIRSEGQFNTVVYEEEDLYRGQERRDIILLHADDIRRLGLQPDWRVTVRSSVGEMRNILVREYDIRPGNAAMYAPEANVLVPRTADPESRTPAFKSIVVTLHAQTADAARVSLPISR
jgi:molybdopterin-dependent oxidoreductase alpha subunit